LSPSRFTHATVPCEGIGRNREYDKVDHPLDAVLKEDWRPGKPQLTDTVCQVVGVYKGDRLAGFFSYFGCHPVVCCAATSAIHGDFCGVATNMLEREHPGSIGLFLQGAQGDVNSCVVHKPLPESMLALDVIAARYARSVRQGLASASPMEVDRVHTIRRERVFQRHTFSVDELAAQLDQHEQVLSAPAAGDDDRAYRMSIIHAGALRKLIQAARDGTQREPAAEIQGIRLGPLALLACPFEVFQAIKNEIVSQAASPVPLVMGIANDFQGYAPDRQTAAAGGYAAQTVPMILGDLPFASIHDELVESLVALDHSLNGA
jgi:hypothetical protein